MTQQDIATIFGSEIVGAVRVNHGQLDSLKDTSMATKSKKDRPSHACPKCGGEDIAGLVAAFWASVGPDGDLLSGWRELDGETEVGHERMCRDCDARWDYGDATP